MPESVDEFIRRKEIEFREKDKTIEMKDIGRKGAVFFKREKWAFLPQHNLNKKVFVFERLRKHDHSGALAHRGSWKKGDIEYRIGYFIIGRNGTRKGKWTWGQFCPLIPATDLLRLLNRARTQKVLLE